jgi:hypothetical protein
MTVPEIYASAEKLARELPVAAGRADTLLDDANAMRHEAKALAGRLAGNDDARVLADLAEEMHSTIRELAKRLDALSDDAGHVECALDNLQHDHEAASDVAGMVLDVERGVRDRIELLEACRGFATMYVL